MKIRHPKILNVERKITNRGIRKIIYFFPSLINKSLVSCESGLEWDLLHHLELDHSAIQSYKSQPHKLVYYDRRKRRSYTPDFLINQSDVDLVVEVKPAEKLKARQARKLQEVEIAYAMLGLRFVLITDAYIRKQPQLDNAKYILRYARQRVTRTSMKAMLDLFRCHRGPHTILSVLDRLSPSNVHEHEIFKLIYTGIIKFDPKKPLSHESVIWLNNDVNA